MINSADSWKFFWLSSTRRPTLREALLFDLRNSGLSKNLLEDVLLRVLETLIRLNRHENPKRIDIRPVTRGRDHNLWEIRWELEFEPSKFLLRLFVCLEKEDRIRTGLRFFEKRIHPRLLVTNRAQDCAIDDAIKILLENSGGLRLELDLKEQ
jgi:sulfatase maturation enzyme AslB (radical SAM superfamily)